MSVNDLQSVNDGILDSDDKFRALVENSLSGVYIIKDGKFSYVNQRVADIFEYTQEELVQKTPFEVVHDDDKEHVATNVKKRVSGEKQSIEYSFKGITKNGTIKYIHVFGTSIDYEGGKAIMGSLIDETETILAKQKLEVLASRDALTGLYNRYMFEQELAKTAQKAARFKSKFALIIFDVDNFKRFNDSLGHHVGDAILQEISTRIKRSLRSANLFARIGGDEFAIIVDCYKDKSEIAVLTQRLKKIMQESFVVSSQNLHVSLSIGVSLFPEHTDNPKVLQKLADHALYEVKAAGKNDCVIYSNNKEIMQKSIALEDELYTALSKNEFVFYLQPQIALASEKTVAAEALIRWEHPRDGLLFPGDFLSLANEIGLLYRLDLFMIESAFQTITRWHQKNRVISISVNISNSLFHHHNFLKKMKYFTQEYPQMSHYIELEITEDIINDSQEYTDNLLRELKSLGFKFSIDDFGTGYSSLSHLKMMNIDKLKIDRLFIKDLQSDANDRAITKAIIVMGHALNLQVLAEGAEAKEQVDILASMGCDLVQCFYYSKPVPIDIFEQQWL